MKTKAKTVVKSASKMASKPSASKTPTHTNANQVFMELRRQGLPAYYDKIAALLEKSGIESVTVPYGSSFTTIYPYEPVQTWMANYVAEYRAKQEAKIKPVAAAPAESAPITGGPIDAILKRLDVQNQHIEQIQEAMTTVLAMTGRMLDKMQSIETAMTNIDADVLDGSAAMKDAITAGFVSLRGELQPTLTDILDVLTNPAPARPDHLEEYHAEAAAPMAELDNVLSTHDDDPRPAGGD